MTVLDSSEVPRPGDDGYDEAATLNHSVIPAG
jgi:hypothetical protein